MSTTVNPDSPPDVLALQGSPRRNGNTDILLDRVLETVKAQEHTADKIYIRDLQLSPCLEIGACLKTGRCAIRDDMDRLYDLLLASRVLIIASPIFFYGPSAHLKMVIDRCQALWARKYVLKQDPPGGRGYVVSAGATRGKRLFEGFQLTARYFFDTLNLEPAGGLFAREVDSAGDILKKPDILGQAEEMGLEIAEYLKKLK